LVRGARSAEPGEFTLRAFLSGRLDLTRAEAVLGVIEADTPAQLDSALKQLAGGLAGPIQRLRDRLLDVLAHLEAGLDFVDEDDVDPIARAELANELAEAADDLRSLTARLQARDRPNSLPRVALVGPPNAGKSLLFNALLGASRAIVSPVAGTTRDYLTAPCDCGGLVVELVDTAGIELADGSIGEQAQDHRARQSEAAALVLRCQSSDTPLADLDPARAAVPVWTKSDLAAAPEGWIATSAETGLGLSDLRAAIAERLRGKSREGDWLATTGARCGDSLDHACGGLQAASETLLCGGGDELVAIDLRQAAEELGKVVGAVVTDDILDRIFRRFCIGK
jgi:tRNA modification GTPase